MGSEFIKTWLLLNLKQFLKNLNRELLHDSAILLLDINPREMKTCVHSKNCTWMFIAALYLKAKEWKQPKFSSTNEWIYKTWYVNTMEYYSAKTRNKILMCPIIFHEPWKHYVKWKTLVKNKTTYCPAPAIWSTQKRQIHSDRKWNSGYLGLVVSWIIQGWPLKGVAFLFRVLKML